MTGEIPRGSEEEVEGDAEEDDFVDEVEPDCEDTVQSLGTKGSTVGRTVTLQMLLEANILQPGEANMSIEYLGQRFIGDLLTDGKIKSLETDIIFASPSAWACHCKRIINPDKKSGCGWASVKYLGQKLDVFKNKYFKLKALEQEGKDHEGSEEDEPELKQIAHDTPRVPVKHSLLGNRNNMHDSNTLVECVPFSSLGKIQPFLVSLSTNAALVMDFHCHLTTSEVVGYLAGHWDVNAHNLAITTALPCRSRLNDRELGPLVEEEVWRTIESRRLTLVGWYHSHPSAPPLPTIRDVDAQLDYEIRMKGSSDASYIPCVGLICSPYQQENVGLESSMTCYWVVPPPENKPLEYPKPMTMTYSVVQDQYLSQEALNEMKKCVDFYRGDQDFVRFNEKYKDNITYLEKLKTSITSKFPREQNDGLIWSCLSEVICGGGGSTASTSTAPAPLAIPSVVPSVSKTPAAAQPLPPTSMPSFLASADLASALFAKFQIPLGGLSAASLSGLSSAGLSASSLSGLTAASLGAVSPSSVSSPLPSKMPRLPPPPPPPVSS